MKKFTFLLVTFFAMSLFAQVKLTSANHESLVDGVWINDSHKEQYFYDSNGNLTSETFLRWDSVNLKWENMELFEYTYNSKNLLTEELLRFWDGYLAVPAYVDNVKTVYSYDFNDRMVEYIEYFWQDNVWTNSSKFTLSYNSNGKISDGLFYNWVGGEWVLIDRTIITYDDKGNIYNLINDTWDGNNWVQNEATEFTLDSKNKIILEYVKSWNGTEFVDESKTEYQYDVNGNQISEQVYMVVNGLFELNYEMNYNFDTDFLMASFTHPFNQTTGLDYVLTGFPFVNKLLSTSFSSTSRISYNYGEATAAVNDNFVKSITTYPNPTTGIVNLKTEITDLNLIDVFNVLGKKVFSTKQSRIDLTNFSNGIYLLKIYNNEGRVAIKKIIKN